MLTYWDLVGHLFFSKIMTQNIQPNVSRNGSFKIANQLHTPPQSPNLNLIKQLWDELGKRIRTHDVRNQQQLQLEITAEWSSIT